MQPSFYIRRLIYACRQISDSLGLSARLAGRARGGCVMKNRLVLAFVAAALVALAMAARLARAVHLAGLPARPPGAGNPVAAPPSATGAVNPTAASVPAPADTNNLWVERQSNREQPEIHLYNRSRLSGELVIKQRGARRAWAWRRPGLVVSDSVDPVEYTYEIRGPI